MGDRDEAVGHGWVTDWLLWRGAEEGLTSHGKSGKKEGGDKAECLALWPFVWGCLWPCSIPHLHQILATCDPTSENL